MKRLTLSTDPPSLLAHSTEPTPHSSTRSCSEYSNSSWLFWSSLHLYFYHNLRVLFMCVMCVHGIVKLCNTTKCYCIKFYCLYVFCMYFVIFCTSDAAYIRLYLYTLYRVLYIICTFTYNFTFCILLYSSLLIILMHLTLIYIVLYKLLVTFVCCIMHIIYKIIHYYT